MSAKKADSRESVVFLSAVRTPFGTFGGKLKALSPIDLAVHASKAAIERAGIDTPSFCTASGAREMRVSP